MKKEPKFRLNLIPLEERIVLDAAIVAAVHQATAAHSLTTSTQDIIGTALTAPPLTHAAANDSVSNAATASDPPSWIPSTSVESLNTSKAQILYVNANDTSSTQNGTLSHPYEYLQNALNYASEHPGTQYQILMATGTYIPGETQASPTYSPSSTFDIPDNVVLIEGGFNGTFSANQGLPTYLNGENAVNTIVTVNDSTVELSGLTIENALNTSLSGNGGGLYESNNANVFLVNDTFTNDVVEGYGGAIYSINSTLNISNSTFSSNTAGDGGGAIASQNDPNLYIQGSTFTNNSEVNSWYIAETSDMGGGAIFSSGDNLTLNSDTFGSINSQGQTSNGNEAGVGVAGALGSFGGAVLTDNDNVSISHSDFYGNTTDITPGSSLGFGGAVASGVFTPDLSLTISNSVFNGNQSDFGGAVFAGASYPVVSTQIVGDNNVQISNSAFSDNFATYQGGAGYLAANNTVTINGSSFTDNSLSADYGNFFTSGGGALDLEGNTSVVVSNSQFDGNIAYSQSTVYSLGGGAVFSGLGFLGEGNNSVSFQGDTFNDNTAFGALGAGGAIYSYIDSSLSINNCVFNENTALTFGGAVFAELDVSVNIDNSQFFNNSVSSNQIINYGGALFTGLNGSVSYVSDTFIGNTSGTQPGDAISIGGAIFSEGENLSVTNSTFIDNSTSAEGGAIFSVVDGTIVITQDQFIGNTVIDNDTTNEPVPTPENLGESLYGATENAGGAVYIAASDPNSNLLLGLYGINLQFSTTITNDTFIGNAVTTSNGNGGAVLISADDNVNFSNDTFISNTAQYGGALFIAGSTPVTISQSTFISNGDSASGIQSYGGALYISQSDVSLSENTFLSNTALRGGAIYVAFSNTINLESSNFIGNQAALGGAIYMDLNNDTVTIGQTAKNTFQSNSVSNPDLSSTQAGKDIYVALASTLDSHITAGTVNGQSTSSGIIEALAPQTKNVSVPTAPTILEVGGDGSYSTLQAALTKALYLGLTDIKLAGGAYTPLQGFSLPKGANPSAVSFNLSSDVELSGGWNKTFTIENTTLYPTTLSGIIGNGNSYTVVTDLEGTVVVNSVSITGGDSDNNNSDTASSGGGIYAYNAFLVVGNANIYGNSAAAFGGGIYNFGQADGDTGVGSTIIYNSTFSNNTALEGGGMWLSDQFAVNISNSTFNNNISTVIPASGVGLGLGGGAIEFFADSQINIISSSFSNNSTDGNGGAIASNTSALNIQGSTFTDNQAEQGGGGAIYSEDNVELSEFSASSTMTIQGSTFTDNQAEQGGAINDNGTTTLVIEDNNFKDTVATPGNTASQGNDIWLSGTEDSVNGISNADMGLDSSNWIAALSSENQHLLEDNIFID